MVCLNMPKFFPLVVHQQSVQFVGPWKYRWICVAKNITDVSGIIILKSIYYAE
jgi:hypothetical protein